LARHGERRIRHARIDWNVRNLAVASSADLQIILRLRGALANYGAIARSAVLDRAPCHRATGRAVRNDSLLDGAGRER
jgi:hypothetical protein